MLIDDEVARDREQPRAYGPAGERVGMPPRPQQRLLHHILRSPRVSGQSQHVSVEGPSVIVEKGPDELFVGGSGWAHIPITYAARLRFTA
ncbi:hypothetical protein GCM10023259_097830 [Thermocatellispora tengchongensis]